MIQRVRSSWLAGALLTGVLAAGTRPAMAQTGAGDGFLFHSPQASLSMRIGVARPSADSKVFSFTSDKLTLDRGDFAGMSAAADLDVAITRRLAFQMGAAFSARESGSEYRDFVDNNDLPIEQRTMFRRAPVTAGLKLYLTSPGRSLGKFAWVPSKFTPYVGGGAGLMYYAFRQSGDFVDFTNFDVFPSTLESSGWTSMAYGSAGINYSLSARMGLVTEARYDRARAPMSADFVGFDRIDLSGLSVTTGLHLRF
ncbi:MAG: hypothetical protein IPP90_18505 [Gemmatimonadaceae bacterium]|nr:hypothetical protein [Gemmatimonadaceae bacterium]